MKMFFDLDGTLTEWKSASAYEDLLKKGYFRNLQPLNSVAVVKLLSKWSEHIYILSAVMEESLYAASEKMEWVREYLPEIPEDHILFSTDGKSKREFVKNYFGEVSKSDLLIDDYSINLDDWAKEGTPVKFLNGINGSHGRQYERAIHNEDDTTLNAQYLDYLLHSFSVKEAV
jgi:5'(3')-deoxyribonucleotidase